MCVLCVHVCVCACVRVCVCVCVCVCVKGPHVPTQLCLGHMHVCVGPITPEQEVLALSASTASAEKRGDGEEAMAASVRIAATELIEIFSLSLSLSLRRCMIQPHREWV